MKLPLAAWLLALASAAGAQEGHDLFTGQATASDPTAERRLARFPCHTCHGRDGTGGVEGDVPPIDWPRLAAPSAERPGYDAETFHRAVTEGVASNGRPLSRLMPRYALTEPETTTLRAYLGQLHDIQRRGVAPDHLRIGVAILPGEDAISDAYLSAVTAALAGRLGGTDAYGRRVDLVPADPTRPEAANDVLAIIGLPVAAAERFTQRGIPVLAPIGAPSGTEDPSILRGITPSREALHAAIAREVGAAGTGPVFVVSQDPSDRDAVALALALVAPDRPLADGIEKAEDIVVLDASPPPVSEADRIWITWQSLALRETMETDATIMVVLETPRLVADAIEAQAHPLLIHAQEAGIVLAEALKAAGRDVTRARLLQALEETVLVDIGLDYDRIPLTGTDEIAVFRLP